MRKQSIDKSRRLAQLPRRLVVAVAATLCVPPAQATVGIASSPLLTSSAVAPNIMFVLDDSGSMQWEFMPDSLSPATSYVYPRPRDNTSVTGSNGTAVYGASDYGNQVPNYENDNRYNLRMRSPDNNLVYYNPAINYQPWRTFNGTASVAVTGASSGNVDPRNAPYNPYETGRGRLDLNPSGSSGIRLYADWRSTSGGSCQGTASCYFWPITYYMYNGSGSFDSASSYTRYQVRNSRAYRWNLNGGSEQEVTSLTWTDSEGNAFTRTVAEEIQNFANWFTYYRSRLLSARGGASLAFTTLGENYRVGFTTINRTGQSSYTHDIDTNADFSTTARSSWFDKLLGVNVSTSGTPLRPALKWAGEYYSGNIDGNKWAPADEAACRRSFTILTTDGYWNGSSPSVGNSDGTDGPIHTNHLPEGKPGGYVAGPPYEDSYPNTLADVAMEYWKNDLDAADNKVKPTPDDPNAFWQHMNTFTLSIGLRGTLDPKQKLDKNFPGWPDSTQGDQNRKIDDLWHAAVNGRGQFVPARDPVEFANGLAAALKAISDVAGSASSLSGNTTSLSTESMVFQARYVAGVWSGDLRAWKLDSSSGGVIVNTDANGNPVPEWSASEELDSITPANRNIWTSIGGTPVEFLSTNSTVVGALGGGATAALVNYLRGGRGGEGAGVTEFRQREGVLGDIVNSTPAFVAHPPNRLWERSSIPGAGGYQAFRSNNANRAPRVYVGANDGMLHAFDAHDGQNGGGQEKFAYVPSAVHSKLIELARQDYAHEFYVDGDVTVEDIYDGTSWRSLLVGSLGRGGRMLFGLDVTNPAAAFGAGNVMWEVGSADVAELGHVLSTPVIAPMNNGKWGVIVGNGYNGVDDEAHLIVLDAATGAKIAVLDTDNVTSNGLSGVGGWDDDGDGDVDVLYAGDLEGRMWKFDVSAADPASWTTANGGSPIFAAVRLGKKQPITAPPLVGRHPDTGELWVFFGTGRFISTSDRSDTSVQTWYGIRDKIVDAVQNVPGRTDIAERIIKEQGVYVSTTSGGNTSYNAIADGSPVPQGATTVGHYRIVSDPLDGSGQGTDDLVDSSGNYVKHGWYLDLLPPGSSGTGERMLVRNTLLKNVLLGETLTPNTSPCGELGDGWLMAINPWFGGRPVHEFFDIDGDGDIDEYDRIGGDTVTGWKHGNGGMPYIQRCKDGLCVTSASTDGDSPPETVNAKDDTVRGRLSWRELMED